MKKSKTSFFKIERLLAVVLSIIMTSCIGQVQTESKESHRSLVTRSIEFDETKDPLFFIDGQLCQHVREIFQDSKGNLWIGTNVYDLMLYNGDSLKYITEKDGFIEGGRVTGIVEDDEGNVWFATAFGLKKYDGKSFTNYNVDDGLANSEIWSLIIDANGVFWIGQNEGLTRYDGKRFENISVPKAAVKDPKIKYAPDRITAIVEDRKGNLWLGTDGYGICKYDGKSFTHFTTEDGLLDNNIHSLMIDAKDDLWIGTFWDGLSKFDGEKFNNFTENKALNGHGIHALFEDNNGDIWIGIKNNGVSKYNGDSFTHYSRELFSNGSILSIYKDHENRFWFGGWGGLFRYDDKSFSSVTKDGPWKSSNQLKSFQDENH